MMRYWDKLKQPPSWAIKRITGGRLKGKSDINPQWRYQVMTELFGPCGVGWKYTINRVWSEPGSADQIFAFAEISLYIKEGDNWSEPIPGIGGSMLVEKEKEGLHSSDEGYKMAVTDALSVALKMLGVAADIYAGKWDGSKYRDAGGSDAPAPSGLSPENKKRLSTIHEYLLADALGSQMQAENRMKVVTHKNHWNDLDDEDVAVLWVKYGKTAEEFNKTTRR
jgi:hypothetical protein